MNGRIRSILRQVHLWLGLTLGAFFVLLGLTGSALVFYQEIDAMLHPEIRVEVAGPAPGWSSPVWDNALATVRRQWPGDRGQWRFEITDEAGPIAARYYPLDAPVSHMSKRKMVWLSPDGTRLLRHDAWGDYAMTWIYDLHMEILSGEAGHKVVGWSGLAILVLLGTGVAAWWPRGSWSKALAFRRGAAPLRRLHDLHKLSGLWSLLLLILFAGTGLMLALPAESNWVMARAIAPIDVLPSPKSRHQDGSPISILAALDAAHRMLPDARLSWIEMPPDGKSVIRLRVQVPGDPSRRFPHSYVYVDQYTGSVLAIVDARQSSVSTKINNWLHPLHDASIGGFPTRILAFVIGLAPAILFITGLLRWRQRHIRIRRKQCQKS